MRDIVVTLLVLGTLPMILKRPYIGILAWAWLSYMNPHKLSWGFAHSMPFAQIVAITFLCSLLFNGQSIRLPRNFTVYCMVMFLGWMLFTSFMAFYPGAALDYYSQVLKIQLFTLLTIAVIKDLKQLNQLITVIALSIGFFSIKGGIFTVLTGGGFRVYGPPSTFIEENNALAVATLMIIPLMYYLARISNSENIRRFWYFATFASFASAVGSQSRGAMVAILFVAFFFWLRSTGKIVSGLVIVIVLVTGYQYMPESWHERMRTTIDYQEDASAMSRLGSWEFNYNLANARFTGGGFKKDTKEMYAAYFGHVDRAFVAHSIYFSTLGDHGWFGLLLFLLILMTTWRRLSGISKLSKKYQDSDHLFLLARMLQVSLVAYMSGGAFLNLAHFDLPWHIVAIALILQLVTSQWVLERKEGDGDSKPPRVIGRSRNHRETMVPSL